MQFVTILFVVLYIPYLVVQHGYACIQNPIDEPHCEIVDILHLMDDEEPPSFDCISPQYSNSIHLRHGGEISLECSAPYPIDLEYDSVLPANHFDLSFYKKVNSQQQVPDEPNFNLDSLNMTFYITVFLHGTHIPWAANYLFYSIDDKAKQTKVSVFIEKSFPLFLSEKKEDDSTPAAQAYYDENKETAILPCRVQNWNSTVQLFSPDYEELTDGTFDDLVKFDPRIGFSVTWDPDRIPAGQYRCMTQLGVENDEMKVMVVAPEDYKEPVHKPVTNVEGTITFRSYGDNHVAQCKAPKRLPPKVFGLVNVRSKNPTTTRYTHGCLDPDVVCENRKTGATTDDGLYEINPVYRSGLLKCADKQTLEYFFGSDNLIYMSFDEAKSKNALVQVKPVGEGSQHYVPKDKYEMVCRIANYHCVKPIFWSIHFKNQTQGQHFESVKETMEFVMSDDIIGVSCGVSLWDSGQWYSSYLPIKAANTSAPEINADVTQFVFELGSINRVLRCKVTGIPKPKLKWLRDGKEVNSSLSVQSENDSDELVLLFPHITTEDDGEYVCHASNSLGEADVSFSVQVMEQDFTPTLLAPPPPITVTMVGDSSCTNRTTTISTTKIITFFQFQPQHSDGQITVPSRDKIRPGDVLYLFIPNINSRRPEGMPVGMNLTVRVLSMDSNEELPVPGTSSDQQHGASYQKWVVILTILAICGILALIVLCGRLCS